MHERRLALMKVEIAAVEVAGIGKLAPIANDDPARVGAFDEPFGLEALQRAVDMDRSEARRVGQLLLSHRQLVVCLFSQTRNLEPERELAKQMGNARRRVAAAD